MNKKTAPDIENPDRILPYFKVEWATLLLVTISGIICNIGLLAGPWFEGRLAQCLFDIFGKQKSFGDMVRLAAFYISTIAVVQLSRFFKRFYVRRFANNVNRNMKRILYGNLVHKSKHELEREDAGSVLTKAISDVDACSEGVRKFTTEIFDTGIASIGYVSLLLWYDWRLTCLCLIFPPFSYLIAEKMKVVVQRSGAAFKESAGRLNAVTLDRAANAVSYRVFGCEPQRDQDYEKHLNDYQKSAIWANIWVSAMPPLYRIVSMLSVVFILYFGSKNVLQTGWKSWDIAAFTTFLACFTKLSDRASKAAKLFNAVQKAEVSWKRIKPLMRRPPDEKPERQLPPASLEVHNLCFSYPDLPLIFENLSFTAEPGQIIGITGPIACGKSTLGKTFLCEFPYQGSIRLKGQELRQLPEDLRCALIAYQGHDPELLSDSVKNNILLGDHIDPWSCLRAVCLDKEVAAMPQGIDTLVGSGGIRLSGGQQDRLALARTLAHKKPLLILDDPFSALDRQTEQQIFENLKKLSSDCIILLISHRLYLFPQTDQVIWMENGQTIVDTHEQLMKTNPQYARLHRMQCEGGESGEA